MIRSANFQFKQVATAIEKWGKMSKSSSWLTGALLGGVLGSALVLLLTPYSGKDVKARVTDYFENVLQEVQQAGAEKRLELETQLEQLRSGKI